MSDPIDYGRDSSGRYVGNLQAMPAHELRGESQATIADFFGSIPRCLIDRIKQQEAAAYIANDAIYLFRLADLNGVDLIHAVNVRMAELRRAGGKDQP